MGERVTWTAGAGPMVPCPSHEEDPAPCRPGHRFARTGDVVEAPCPDCQPGDSWCDTCGEWSDTEYGQFLIPSGTVAVRLTEDPSEKAIWGHTVTSDDFAGWDDPEGMAEECNSMPLAIRWVCAGERVDERTGMVECRKTTAWHDDAIHEGIRTRRLPEHMCERCGRYNPPWACLAPTWQEATGVDDGEAGGVYCLTCFVHLHEAAVGDTAGLWMLLTRAQYEAMDGDDG